MASSSSPLNMRAPVYLSAVMMSGAGKDETSATLPAILQRDDFAAHDGLGILPATQQQSPRNRPLAVRLPAACLPMARAIAMRSPPYV